MSQGQLADAIGISQQAVSRIEDGQTRRPRNLDEMAGVLGVTTSYLYGESHDTDTNNSEDDDVVAVPLYEFRAGMGGGGIIIDERPNGSFPLSAEYVRNQRLQSAKLIGFELEGDSMAPTLMSGDQAMANTLDKNPARGGIFAIFDSDTLVVKRIEKIPSSDPVQLRLISDNPHHSSYDVLADDTNIIGRVIWFARRL